ncbi:hypothetical protein Agub_g12607, partial [Astrephomene gubernaculifera]
MLTSRLATPIRVSVKDSGLRVISACPLQRSCVSRRGLAYNLHGLTAPTTRGQYAAPARAAGGGGGGSGGAAGGGGGGAGSSSGGAGGDSSQPHPMRYFTFGFALLLAAGGALAFARKRSGKSLAAASGAALILGLCGRAMVGAAAQGPARVAFAMCTLLGVVMASRF